MKDLRVLSEETGLDYVSTTDQANGYPSNIRIAITGFETWEEAEKIAAENNLMLIQIEKKDGWKVWYRKGAADSPISVSPEDFGENYSAIYPCSQKDFLTYEVEDDMITLLCDDEFDSIDEIQAYLNNKKKIQDKVIALEKGEFALMNLGTYVETVKSPTMRCHIDTTTTAIAAIQRYF